ncbi:MAG: MFS transporter [Candidatus Lokiarchaeota archaeon]|nr:MFS transporter [Candidatus Lokiarchaeota archaeon]
MEKDAISRELHGKKKYGYVIGNFGVFLNSIFINVFITNYYIYTVNVDSLFILIAFSSQQVIAAISAIIFGILVDNKKPGRFGKRRPFLLYGLPIWAITAVLIWMPPVLNPQDGSMTGIIGAYFWLIGLINFVLGQSILSPHASMLPEQSQTLKNREDVNSITTLLTIIGSVIGMILPLIVKSVLVDPQNVGWWTYSGKTLLFAMPIISLIVVSFGVFCILITFFSVDESFHKKIHYEQIVKKSIKETFKHMTIPARDKEFRKVFSISMLTSIAGSIMGFVVIPFLDFVMLFHGNNYYIYIITSISNKIAWYFLWVAVIKRKGLIFSYKWVILISIVTSSCIMIFLLNDLSFTIKVIIFVITIGTLLGSIYAFRLFTTPLTALLVTEAAKMEHLSNIDESVAKLSGSYFGFVNFTFSIGNAIAYIILAFIFTGNNKSNTIIIILTFTSMAFFFILSFLILKTMRIKEND